MSRVSDKVPVYVSRPSLLLLMKSVVGSDAMEFYRDYIELCPKEVFCNTWKTAEVFKSQPEG